jgi:phage portal protein BeeE
MGIWSAFKWPSLPRPDYLSSPWGDADSAQLTQIAYSEALGVDLTTLTREAAMSVPAVSKARDLITGSISKLPLVLLNADGPLEPKLQQPWLYRTNGMISPFLRMVQTLDDLLFYGECLWSVVRGSGGQILTADRVPYEWWKLTPEGAITINDALVDADEVIYIPSHTSGLLKRGKAIKSARDIDAAVAKRIANPIPVTEIHQLTDDYMSPAEQLALVAAYNKARRDPEGTTVFTPNSVQLVIHGDKVDFGFAAEGRNAARLDIANLTGIPASLLEGTSAAASLTYETTEGRRSEFYQFGLTSWLSTIETRFSQDDVVARGLSVRFDLGDLSATVPSPTGPASQD